MGFLDKVKSSVTLKGDAQNSASDEANTQAMQPSASAAQSSAELAKEKKKIEDVLEVLQISPTFEIPAEIFLPEDLREVNFDIQVPSGFDKSQVTRFVHQSRTSIKFLVELLKKRNEDVAKLATTVDRLQVDTNNLRYDVEIANGISVMPTDDDADTEGQLMEAKLKIKRLQDQLDKATAGGPTGLRDEEREAYGLLQDELSLAKRNNVRLEEELLNLRGRIALMEESEDDALNDMPGTGAALTAEEMEELGLMPASEMFSNHEDDDEKFSLPLPTPSGINRNSISLPAGDDFDLTPPSRVATRKFGVFDEDDDEDDQFKF